jgi:hypothetical protein
VLHLTRFHAPLLPFAHSYNAVNGVPSCADPKLLQGQVRGKWGFDGYITSDCGAVNDVQNAADHGYISDPSKAVKAVLEAGMDSDCGGFLGAHMAKGIADGTVSAADYGTALTNMFMVRMRLGQFDDAAAQPYMQYGTDRIDTAEHQQLALEAALQGMVLLKNEGGTLPLAKGPTLGVAVLGPTADDGGVLQGNYQGVAPYLVTPRAAIAAYANVTFVQGCSTVSDDACADTANAAKAAAAAAATVLVVGLDQSQESEGHDRTSISFPGKQEALIAAVAAASPTPIVVVLMAGSSVDLSAAKANAKVGAILFVGYPGQSGGTAIAQTLFGDSVPSGRLTVTFYPEAYTGECKMSDMNMRPNATTGCTGRSYRFYTGAPVYKFGAGLSYTSFATAVRVNQQGDAEQSTASKAALEATMAATMEHEAPALATAAATVTNTGAVAADHTVLLFAVPPTAGVGGAPLRTLVGFERIAALAPGASATVAIPLNAYAFSYAAADGTRVSVAGAWLLEAGEASTTFTVL